jgi:hypothetical protein
MIAPKEPANIHMASPESIHFLEQFSAVYSDPEIIDRTISHPIRVADNVAAFASDFVPQRLYDVAILHDVVDRFEVTPDTKIRDAARKALSGYFNELNTKEAKYVSCVLADMSVSEQASERYREAAALQIIGERHNGIHLPSHHGDLPDEYWRLDAPLPDIKGMAILAKETNIETHVVRAAEKIDNIWLPPKHDSALFLDIVEVEYFDVPKLEIIGFDGMAMSARDVALRTRYEKLGEESVLSRAAKLHEDARKLSVHRMFSMVVGEENFHIKHVVKDMGREPFVEIGDFDFKDPNGRNASGKFRIKSIGSIADKLQRYGQDVPMDIFATTVIEDDVQSSADMFATMIELLSDNSLVSLIPAKSKKKALYAQGGEDYLQSIAKALQDRGIDLSDVQFEPIEADGYEVSKITFNLCHDSVTTPSEVQFVTKEKRHEARLGRNAHHALKSGDSTVDIESMESIYERKSKMTPDPKSPDYLRVNGQSLKRGLNLLKRIKA